ncbi:hypothetical protein DL770_000791 [Monosporascus sp. CRB-9-2]|nr:hypothetical protein DL770_000791 [Monosporascus sp. CRB-9-2]
MFLRIFVLGLFAVPPTLAAFEGDIMPGYTANNIRYLGCANELPSRALPGDSYINAAMTVEACQNYCNTANYPMSGIMAGQQCYCGQGLSLGSDIAPDGNVKCTTPCGGDSRQRCGSQTHLSVFNSTNFVYATSPSRVNGWNYHTCFMEPSWDAVLENLVATNQLVFFERNDMRIGLCVDECNKRGYSVAGLQAGRECWCGRTIDDRYWSDANDPSCRMTCGTLCAGNKAQICGGKEALAVYLKPK